MTTWGKVYKDLHDHRKTRAARKCGERPRDASAMGLWVLALSWCVENYHTDGWVPADELDRWDTDAERLSAVLVDAGYWTPAEQHGEAGFQFHKWTDKQESAEKIDAKKAKGAAREAARRSAQGVRAHSADTPETVGVPDTEADAKSEGGARKRATQLPADFTPNDTNRRLAAERGLDLRAVYEQFADFHRSKGNTFKDWHLALNNWIRREQPPLPATTTPRPRLVVAMCDGTDCQPNRHEWTDRHGRNRFLCDGNAA